MPTFSLLTGLFAAGALCLVPGVSAQAPSLAADDPVVLVVHGGAGSLRPGLLSADGEAAVRASIEGALRAGHAALAAGSALDAVEAAITRLEDDPQFNAGRGAVLAADGTARHDASVMDGRTGGAGASAGTMHVRHPITLARRVMEASPHVLLTGDGAEAFAREQGLETVENDWFITDDARRTLEAVQQRERESRGDALVLPESARVGTVGAVAMGADGTLAAGTSTGGMTNKRWGRIGDSPIVGAGTWADGACGVSATGHGEFFIRLGVARDIAARVAYLGETCAAAARHVVGRTLTDAGGAGGVIALGADGVAAMPFNTSGMSRGTITRSGVVRVYLFADEEGGDR